MNMATRVLHELHFLSNHGRPLDLPLVPENGERQVRHQQTLPQTPNKGDGVEEVCIPAAGVDPQVIERRTEERRVQQRRRRDERVPHDGEQVAVEREHAEEEARVGDGRVRLEDGEDAHEDGEGGERLGAQADGQAADVGEEVQPEDGEEEAAEGVEDLDEEVPPEADVGREVGERELDAVGALEEGPRVPRQDEGHAEEGGQAAGHDGGVRGGEVYGRGDPALLGLAVVGEDEQGWEHDQRVQGEVGGEGHRDHGVEGGAVEGL